MKYEILSVRPSLLPQYLKKVVSICLLTKDQMRKGREFKNIGLRPREVVGAFLLFAVGQFLDPDNVWTIGSDPQILDGVICCVDGPKKGDYVALEQVYIPSFEKEDLSLLIKDRIDRKTAKGDDYSNGRHLVIYCDTNADLNLDDVSRYLEKQDKFYSYWIMARLDKPLWNFLVASPKTSGDPRLAYKVSFSEDFTNWSVEVMGRI